MQINLIKMFSFHSIAVTVEVLRRQEWKSEICLLNLVQGKVGCI